MGESAAKTGDTSVPPKGPPRRTAVLVVHGMGDQRPIATTRSLVEAVWTSDPTVSEREDGYWLVPDRDGTDLDLPVFATEPMKGDTQRRVDFYELYWAHLMGETRWIAILLWLFEQVRKGPSGLRLDLRIAWFLAAPLLVTVLLSSILMAIQVVAVVGGRFSLGGSLIGVPLDILLPWVLTAIFLVFATGVLGLVVLGGVLVLTIAGAAVFGAPGIVLTDMMFRLGDWTNLVVAAGFVAFYAGLNAKLLETVLGDVGRYFRNSPANIAVRWATRRLGVETLERLHAGDRYDRIVVVAHSLGSVIAYDVLRAFWARYCRVPKDVDGVPGLDRQDDVGKGTEPRTRVHLDAEQAEAWRDRARPLNLALRGVARRPDAGPPPDDLRAPREWRVTDFVTLGSPLAHANYLIAGGKNRAEREALFERRCAERELPQSPAWRDHNSGTLTFVGDDDDRRRLHHGGLFAVTRWTNLHFRAGILCGDPFGGPVGRLFGDGVKDVEVTFDGRTPFFGHTKYWDLESKAQSHLADLRAAIDLRFMADPPQAGS